MRKKKNDIEKKDFRFQSKDFYKELDKFFFSTHFNVLILEPLIRHLLLIDKGTGYHTVEIIIRDHKVAIIKGADTQKIELPITFQMV